MTLLLSKVIKIIVIDSLVFLICMFGEINNVLSTDQTNSFDELPDQIIIGIRTSSFPIGRVIEPERRDETTGEIKKYGVYDGFCGRLEQQLEDEIKRLRELGKLIKDIEVNSITIANEYRGKEFIRYKGLRDGSIHIECGPNSISSLELLDENDNPFSESIDFVHSFTSDHVKEYKDFYTTGIKLLLKYEKKTELYNLNENQLIEELRNLRIGAITKTTTSDQLLKAKEYYPQFIPQGLDDKKSYAKEVALDSLESSDKDSIEAYAGDAVMLMDLLTRGVEEKRDKDNNIYQKARERYDKRGYELYPDKPEEYLPELDKQEYGIAIKKDTLGYSAEDLNNLILSVLNDSPLNEFERKLIKEYEQKPIYHWSELLVILLITISVPFIFVGIIIVVLESIEKSKSKNKTGENKIMDSTGSKNPNNITNINIHGTGATPIQFNQHHSQGSQYNNLEQQKIEKALNDFKKIVLDLQQKYPHASEQRATAIIDAELEEIQHNQPQRWKDILRLKRLWNGLRQSTINVGEYFAEETPWGKAALGFLEGFTDET